MNLIDKFSSFDMNVSTRISDTDQAACELEQTAYDKALSFLRQTKESVVDAVREQEHLLSGVTRTYHIYPYIMDETLSEASIAYGIALAHISFIEAICDYFNRVYGGDFHFQSICEKLLPKRPASDRDADNSAYRYWLDENHKINLRYEMILDEIFRQLGGYSLQETGVVVRKRNVWKAAFRHDDRKDKWVPEYKVKGETISFGGGTHSFCSRKTDADGKYWELSYPGCMIVDALSDFECGTFGNNLCFSSFYSTDTGEVNFPEMRKIDRFRFYKTGRWDVVFSEASHLWAFVAEYLTDNPMMEETA